MTTEERERTQRLLRNWGLEYGEDPERVESGYPNVSPMFQDAPFLKEDLVPSKPIIREEAERAEKIMCKLRRTHQMEFEVVRAVYAYKIPMQVIADTAGKTVRGMYYIRDRGEQYFYKAWRMDYGIL